MFSRFWLLSLSAVLFLSGCIGRVGEDPPEQKQQEIGGTQCMSDALPVVTRFMKGEARNEEVASAWDCVGSAIDKFSKYVGGKTSNQYTSQELATFIERNFLKEGDNKVITPELQLEFMKIKQVFVGGSLNFVTKEELKRTQEVIATFKSVSLKINPYMIVFVQNWSTSKGANLQRDMRFFEEANEAGQEVAKEVAALITKNHQAYALQDLAVLLEELSDFYGEDWESVRNLKKFMPVVKKIKKAIAGGDESTVSPTEWKSFLLLGVRGYVQYLRYVYFIESVPETGSGLRLAYLARSFEDAFSVFQDLVQEKPGGVVSREEISDLLFSFSREWPEFKVSEAAIIEVMKLKQAVFGGSTESWSTTDFETAKLKVDRLKAIFERFMPYFNVYGMDWDPEIYSHEDSQKFFMDAQYNLEASGQELGALIESNYRLEDLRSLVFELEKLYPGEDGAANATANVDRLSPVVARIKNIVFSENDNVLRKENWSAFLRLTARGYMDFLYWKYFVKGASSQDSHGLSSIDTLVQQSLNILRDILAIKKGAQISKLELKNLMLDLKEADLLSDKLTPEAIDSFLGYALNHIANPPQKRLSGYMPEALTLDSVEFLRGEYHLWSEGERFANEIFFKRGLKTPGETVAIYEAAERAVASELQRRVLNEFLRALRTPVPLVVSAKGKLKISNKKPVFYDRESLSHLNLYRAFARILMNAMTGDLARLQSYQGFTVQEADLAFKSLRGFFVELEFLDPKSLTFADSRFREANIFVPHSDGNTLASFEETLDIVGMLFSGVQNSGELAQNLIGVCVPVGALITNDTLLDLDCVRKVYRQQLPLVLIELPDYIQFQAKAPRADFDIYLTNIFKAAGYVGNNKKQVRYGDVSLIPHIVQYVEMIFARFDKNKDGFISTPDAMHAFPAFRGIILDLARDQIKSGTLAEKDLDDLFTYILRYGRPPTSIGDKAQFALRWRNRPQNWDVWADRVQLATILGFIADEVAKASANAPQ